MKSNRKNSLRKEKVIMLASSVLVLTALTLTGIYMQNNEKESKDDGYTLDFTALEENAEKKTQELADKGTSWSSQQNNQKTTPALPQQNQDELDYMPLEAGSGNVKNPGVTRVQGETDPLTDKKDREPASRPEEKTDTETAQESQESGSQSILRELHFAETEGLLRPVSGEVLIPFSMEGSVYFTTLDQYKYNPALMLVATEGMSVSSCADGKVTDVFRDAEIGNAVTVELGDGYQITYGQLANINVSVGSYVDEGTEIGTIAPPTKYYTKEGANLYLKLTVNGVPTDPEVLFR
ncbi:MAG: peptidoglycan DD-metalloendopeptidase family protein [Acetatifactor sp.]